MNDDFAPLDDWSSLTLTSHFIVPKRIIPVSSRISANEIVVSGQGRPELMTLISKWCAENEMLIVMQITESINPAHVDRIIFLKEEDAVLAYMALCGRDTVTF